MLYSIWATNYIYIYDNPMMMNSAMFSSVQETLQSRRGRKRRKRDFWEPEGWGDHRGKRYFKGSVRGCELVRKRLNPQLWSRLLALCVCARWWNLCFEFKVAVSTFLPWFILILLWLIDKYSLYERIHQVLSQCCPRYFLMVGQIIHGNKHDTLLEIKAGGAVDSYQIDTHTNLWYGQEAY